MSDDLSHALPHSLALELEVLLADLPDREDKVYRIRRFAGVIYASGHQAGRLIASIEAHYDRTATPEGREGS